MTGALPQIIQGGMGVGVSNWRLARTVAALGQLGVVSGTALDVVLARRLQDGDAGGEVRRALAHFPYPEMAARVIADFFLEGGRAPGKPYRPVVFASQASPRRLLELTVLANFVEVWLAKEGHGGMVGINFLEKIQLPTLPSLFGAMLGGVDCVLMGAGIPRAVPGVLDRLAAGEDVAIRLEVAGDDVPETTAFSPRDFCGGTPPSLRRPLFFPVISSATLAITLARKSQGKVDGFIVEGATAGGHNAPPRGPMQLSEAGEPIYGERDAADLVKIRALGLPFWLAGSFGAPGRLAAALATGATGIQVGTAFAFCEESGIHPDLKRQVIERARAGNLSVFTDPSASPTGFPFKVLQLEGTAAEPGADEARERVCDLGYLRQAYRKADGVLGYRCASEPVDAFVRKGGTVADTEGRKCICNGLFATIGLGQIQRGGVHELPLMTAGDDVLRVADFCQPGRDSYGAAEVITRLLSEVPAPVPQQA